MVGEAEEKGGKRGGVSRVRENKRLDEREKRGEARREIRENKTMRGRKEGRSEEREGKEGKVRFESQGSKL